MDDEEAHARHVIETFEADGGGLTHGLDPTDETPSYCVSYGWSVTHGCEMIVFGSSLMLAVLPTLIDLVLDHVEAGTPLMDGQRWPAGDGRHLVGRIVHPSHHDRMWFDDARLCRKHAGATDVMHVYQIFWPDKDGKFPWDTASRSGEQPMLFEPRPDVR